MEEFHAAAVKAGGYTDWLPGVRPEFNGQYFAARVRDPDGNSIEAVYRGAVAEAATPQSMAA